MKGNCIIFFVRFVTDIIILLISESSIHAYIYVDNPLTIIRVNLTFTTISANKRSQITEMEKYTSSILLFKIS